MDGGLLTGPFQYCSIVGVVQYLTLTRVDIAHVHMISLYLYAPHTTYLYAIKREFFRHL